MQKIKLELLDSRQKVSSLQELSAQLLVSTKPPTVQTSEQNQRQGSECLEAQEKVHVIWNRMRLLQREVNADLEQLERRMEAADAEKVQTANTSVILLLRNICKNFFSFFLGFFTSSSFWIGGDHQKSQTIGKVNPSLLN